MALLEIKGLRRRFGGVTALDGADLPSSRAASPA